MPREERGTSKLGLISLIFTLLGVASIYVVQQLGTTIWEQGYDPDQTGAAVFLVCLAIGLFLGLLSFHSRTGKVSALLALVIIAVCVAVVAMGWANKTPGTTVW